MNKVFITANSADVTYNFRAELLMRLIEEGYEVIVCVPFNHLVQKIIDIGCEYEELRLSRKGINPVNEFRAIEMYYKILSRVKPDIVLTYTVKPNIYASIASKLLRIPFICNVTGLGVIEQSGLQQKLLFILQRIAFKEAECVFFQNEYNMKLYLEKKIISKKNTIKLIPGSGVNIEKFSAIKYLNEDSVNRFLTIARLRQDKGYDELFYAIDKLRDKAVEFHIIGECEEEVYIAKMKEYLKQGYPIKYHDKLSQEEVRKYIGQSHCIIHPSHTEGMSNAILEGASSARPIITTNIPGCKEAVNDKESGFLYTKKEKEGLVECIELFTRLTLEQKEKMGVNGRLKMEKEFNRNFVVCAYLLEIEKALTSSKSIN